MCRIKTLSEILRRAQDGWERTDRGGHVYLLGGLRHVALFQTLCLVQDHVGGGREGLYVVWVLIHWQGGYRDCLGQHLRLLLLHIGELYVSLVASVLPGILIKSLLKEGGLLLLAVNDHLLLWLRLICRLLLEVLVVLLPLVHLLLLVRRLKYLILVLHHGIRGGVSFDGASPNDAWALIWGPLLLLLRRLLLLLMERRPVVGLSVHGSVMQIW